MQTAACARGTEIAISPSMTNYTEQDDDLEGCTIVITKAPLDSDAWRARAHEEIRVGAAIVAGIIACPNREAAASFAAFINSIGGETRVS